MFLLSIIIIINSLAHQKCKGNFELKHTVCTFLPETDKKFNSFSSKPVTKLKNIYPLTVTYL